MTKELRLFNLCFEFVNNHSMMDLDEYFNDLIFWDSVEEEEITDFFKEVYNIIENDE